jgi:hypothetical protein
MGPERKALRHEALLRMIYWFLHVILAHWLPAEQKYEYNGCIILLYI